MDIQSNCCSFTCFPEGGQNSYPLTKVSMKRLSDLVRKPVFWNFLIHQIPGLCSSDHRRDASGKHSLAE